MKRQATIIASALFAFALVAVLIAADKIPLGVVTVVNGTGGGNLTVSGTGGTDQLLTWDTDTTGHWTSGISSFGVTNLAVLSSMSINITNQLLSTDGSGNVVGVDPVWTNSAGTAALFNNASSISNIFGSVFFAAPPTLINTYGVVGFGDAALDSAVINNCYDIYMTGLSAGASMMATNSDDLYGLGDGVFQGSIFNTVSDVTGLGDTSAQYSTFKNSSILFGAGQSLNGVNFDNVQRTFGLGFTALSNANLTNSSDIYVIGGNSSVTDGTSKSHLFVVGSNGKATNSNDFVFGDNAYNYFFPGASAQFDNAVKVGTSTPWKLGAIKTCSAVTIVLTNYIEVVINGVTNAIPLITVTP